MLTSAKVYYKDGVIVVCPIDMPLKRLINDGVFDEGNKPSEKALINGDRAKVLVRDGQTVVHVYTERRDT